MTLHFDKQQIDSIDDAYAMYKASEFESPTRSTIPLLSWLKHEPWAVGNLLDVLKVPSQRSIHLEYRVQCPKGSKPESQTDFMVLADRLSVSVESKWTEPIGDTVGDWGKSVDEVNGPLVLEGWLQLLRRAGTQDLAKDSFRQAINQMIHRAASACQASENPNLVYLLFRPSFDRQTASQQQVRDELAHLWRLLGRPSTFKFWLVTINLSFTEKYRRIFGLPKQSQETATTVKDALGSTERLFYFGNPVIERIGTET